MKVLEIKNLVKKDIPLHYRNEYSGTFVVKGIHGKDDLDTEFILERDAIGNIDISVQLLSKPDYPILPVIRELKKYILELDKTGML